MSIWRRTAGVFQLAVGALPQERNTFVARGVGTHAFCALSIDGGADFCY